jgi:hypothetical protein
LYSKFSRYSNNWQSSKGNVLDQPTALLISELQASITELFTKNAILFAQIIRWPVNDVGSSSPREKSTAVETGRGASPSDRFII